MDPARLLGVYPEGLKHVLQPVFELVPQFKTLYYIPWTFCRITELGGDTEQVEASTPDYTALITTRAVFIQFN